MPRPIVPQALCVPCCRGHPPVAIPMPVCERLTVNKMPKSRRSRTTQRGITHDEIQALLSKLKEIVPNMPRNRKLSKLEIIQYVIDYIVDLQIALESHPGSNRGVNNTLPNPRQPLGVISSPSNSSNTCLSNEVSPKLLPEVSSHSVSC